MNRIKTFLHTVTAVAALTTANLAWGQWQLDSDLSTVAFISTKNAAVSEVHTFTEATGSISTAGSAQINLSLDSVETLIPIRNERMREFLFETGEFSSATITAQIDPTLIQQALDGARVSTQLMLSINLHGMQRKLTAPVSVVATEGNMQVASIQPIIVSAGDFGLAPGIAKLQEIAGLASISTAVPVSVNLVFTQ
jgi:YceI-like domain